MRTRLLVLSLLLVLAVLCGCKKSDDEPLPGMAWTMSDYNPVLEPSTEPSSDLCGWYNHSVSFPWVVLDGSIFKMWFTGTNTEGEDRIGYATSPNGENWNVHNDPVLEAAAPGSWDGGGVWNHCVIKDGSDYKMFYTGYENATAAEDRIGLAYSSDGIAWTREVANPIITTGPPGSFYEKAVYSGTVLTSGSTYQMWFSGLANDNKIRTFYTSSTDCLNWNTPVMVLDAGPETYDSFVAYLPCAIFDVEVYRMWYVGHDGNGFGFCYAISLDGTAWTKLGVASRETQVGAWEDGNFAGACVIRDVNTFRMWYSVECTSDGKVRIGYATSPAP